MTRIEHEKQVVHWMIGIYCKNHHGTKGTLCKDCAELDAYALERLSKCRFGNNKPTCKRCPIHCYEPEKREQIRQVMRYSGPRMIFYHPIAAIRHLIQK